MNVLGEDAVNPQRVSPRTGHVTGVIGTSMNLKIDSKYGRLPCRELGKSLSIYTLLRLARMTSIGLLRAHAAHCFTADGTTPGMVVRDGAKRATWKQLHFTLRSRKMSLFPK